MTSTTNNIICCNNLHLKFVVYLNFIIILNKVLIKFFFFFKELVFTGDTNLVKSMTCWVSMLMAIPCQNPEEASKNKNLKNWLIVM